MRVSRFVHMLKNVCQSVQNHKRIIVKQYFFREERVEERVVFVHACLHVYIFIYTYLCVYVCVVCVVGDEEG